MSIISGQEPSASYRKERKIYTSPGERRFILKILHQFLWLLFKKGMPEFPERSFSGRAATLSGDAPPDQTDCEFVHAQQVAINVQKAAQAVPLASVTH